ncbi:hypothetical protein DFH11DRAFT_1095039 [Phellopilus nigrolimitatus]|nr:hypothetical protein DFH11DRAFT_1095039 [Phellopilus nigrolimitatus]
MSSFAPTQAELGLVNQVFAIADPSKLGIITGDVAVKVFAGAKLSPSVLGEVWAFADKENNGFLTKKGVAIALRLIGHAQKGEHVKEALLDRPGPLAHIEGISAPPSRPSSIPSSPPPTSFPPRGSQYPPLTAEDKSKFLRLFLGCGPVNGLLSGDKARDVFVKSKLPFEKLSQIWSLADTQDRGSLDQTDFTVAMYLIQAIMSKHLANLPATLPPGLYEQAGGRTPVGVVSHSTGGSLSLSPSLTGSFANTVSPLVPQSTGGARARLQPQTTGQDYNRLSMAMPPAHQQPSVHFAPTPVAALGASAFGGVAPSPPWDVTTEEKTRFDSFFDGLDTLKRGFIEGDVAVPFMLQSNLSEDVLAQVWDLADLNHDGRLTREGFAVAMHLIQGKLAGKEIPSTLPVSLVPPSMRPGRLPASAPAPGPAPVSEAVRDLLWDDSPPASATAPQHPGSSLASPPAAQATPILQPQITGQLSQQQTGAFGARPPPISAPAADTFGSSPFFSGPPANRDLLSDDEETTPAAVPDNSAEIGNLQNQISSTNRSLETTKSDRKSTETTLATQASQLSELQTQLASAKAAYETETRLLTALRERFATQSADIQRLREEFIRAESDLSAVRVEKTEIEGSVLRDKEEVRDLQRKMKAVGEEVEQMKAGVEKAKKETKHQKGLLAIAKKQLATRETEKAKVAKELEDSEHEAREVTLEREDAEKEVANDSASAQTNGIASTIPAISAPSRTDSPSFAAAQPLPASPLSPPLSANSTGTKTNNPFERLAMTSSGSRPGSPFSVPAAGVFSPPTAQPQTDVFHSGSPFAPPAASDSTVIADAPSASSPFGFAAEPSTSTTAPSTEQYSTVDTDPFGLTEGDSATSEAETPEKPATPQPAATSTFFEETKATFSADADAVDKKPKEASPSLDATTTEFPALDSHVSRGFSGFDEPSAPQTDLDAKLVEKENEESDSDSDSGNEGEFHDAKEARISLGGPIDELLRPALPKVELEAPVRSNGNGISPPTAPSDTFEDAFGLKDTAPKLEKQDSGLPPSNDFMEDLFTLPSSQSAKKDVVNGKSPEQDTPFGTPTATVSGVSAFDEAMGKISSPSTGSAAPQFQLDSAFDDNFDFSAAQAELEPSPFPPAPTSSFPQSNGSKAPLDYGSPFAAAASSQGEASKSQEGGRKSFSFDDAFGAAGSASSRLSSHPSAGDHGISFEDAFGGGSNKALAFDNAFGAPGVTPNAQAEPELAEPKPAPFPVQSPPRSPKVAATPTSPSTVRSATPPPRVSSPKPRVSTGSSTDGALSNKSPPPQRHSKLSIRLPFGRKDKKKSKFEPPPVPPPPQFLSPVTEPGGLGTPAEEDDVDKVKQLCGMGFSRTQAVSALEKYGYDVERALNNLLGSQ